MNGRQMEAVGLGELKVANRPDQVLVCYGLGSCVGLALYDPVVRVGAMVHVVLPDQDAARIAKTPASAAVFIKHQVGYNLDVLKPQIRTLVTHAIPELGEDRVSVVLIVAQRPTAAASMLPLSAQASAGDRADTSRGTWLWWAIGAVAVACALGAAAIWARSRRRNDMMHDGLLDKGPGLDGFGQG